LSLYSSLETNFRGLVTIKMKWYMELKGMLEGVEAALKLSHATSTATGPVNKYTLKFHSNSLTNILDLLQKTFTN